ncbi:MAG: TonB-dependent receptor [Steroidobacteraceae bacterium]
MRKIWACSTGMLVTMVGIMPAMGQTNATDGLQLEEVIVTAEKREESLQKVATSIQVKEGDELRKEGKKRIDEIMQGTVGIQAQDSQVGVTFFVRGVDSSGGMGAVVAAPILIDGVAQSRSESVRGGTLDLAQAEIMRGPQSTTLGANSLAGAISLVSNKPVFEYQASGTLEVGNFHKLATEGVLNVPLADNQALRIAYSTDKRNGFISSGAGDSDLTNARLKYRWQATDNFDSVLTVSHQNIGGNGVQSGVLLATGHWVPYTAATAASLGLTFTNGCTPGMSTAITVMGCPPTFIAVTDNTNFRQRSNAWDDGYPADAWPNNPYRDTNIDQGSLELNWTTGIGTLTFLPSLQKAHFRSQEPPRGTSWMQEDQKQDTTTYDLRLNSPGGGRVQWQTGLYYSYDKTYDATFLGINFPGAAGMGPTDPSDCATSTVYCYGWTLTPKFDRTGKSVYANAEFSVLDSLRLIGGIRYNNDKASVVALSDVGGTITTPNAAQVAAATISTGARTWKKATYRAGVEWDVLPDTMIYGVYSTGYSPGALSGMDTVGTVETTLDQISLGWKSQLFDRRMQLNGEFFLTKFHNRGVEGTITAYGPGATTSTCSAPAGAMGAVSVGTDTATAGAYCAIIGQNSAIGPEFVSKGLDVDMTWLLTANDRVTLTGEWLDASYDSKPQVTGVDLTAAYLQSLGASASAAPGLAASLNNTLQAFVGAQLQNAPKYSATLDYQHSFEFAGGSKLTPRISAVYKQKYWSFGGAPGANVSQILADSNNPNNLAWQQAYTKWDFLTSWSNADGKFTVTGYVKNLNNEVVLANYTDPYVSLEAPRTYGVTFNANF